MAIREFTKLVFCGNGDKIKYHYYEDLDQPRIECIGHQYFFNRHLVKTEIFRAAKPSQQSSTQPLTI